MMFGRLSGISSRFVSLSGKHWTQACAYASAPEVGFIPEPRPNESLEAKRARLLYQSKKRGILENDLILG